MAAIGIEQLKKFPEFAKKRKYYAKKYYSILNSSGSVDLLKQDFDSIVPHIFVVKLRSHEREKIRRALLAQGIQTGVHYQPNHELSMYKIPQRSSLPITEKIFPKLLSLPLHPDLKDEDIDFVCEKLFDSTK